MEVFDWQAEDGCDLAEKAMEAIRTLAQTLRGAEITVDSLIAERDRLAAERDALAAFKTYTHQRLDGAGIPTHPDGPHSAEGCRVGDRFDLLIAERDRLAVKVAKMREALEAFSPNMMNQVQADVRSCHQMRGPGASSAMRDDDRDLRTDLRKAVEKARAALAPEPTTEAPVMCRCGSVSERACSEATPRFPECEVPDE
jgi:hypothetical protein